jgi:SAM-dependent methyltransferase
MGLMTREVIDREEGRRLFGADPETYDRARPGHADRVYEVLVERCGLGPGSSVLEIGPGTGQATRRLLDLGANPLLAIEPSRELAAYLARSVGDRVDIRETTLEEAQLPHGFFDVATAASSFHWVDEGIGLAVVLRALRPGGWIALWWTGFGDPSRRDPFREATTELLDSMPKSPLGSHRGGRTPTEGGSEMWLAALAAAGYEDASYERIPWTVTFDAKGIRAIFSTFSPFLYVEERTRTETLDELERIARTQFDDHVEKPIATSLYTARKPA